MTRKFAPPAEKAAAERSTVRIFFLSVPDIAISAGILFKFPTPGQTNGSSGTFKGGVLNLPVVVFCPFQDLYHQVCILLVNSLYWLHWCFFPYLPNKYIMLSSKDKVKWPGETWAKISKMWYLWTGSKWTIFHLQCMWRGRYEEEFRLWALVWSQRMPITQPDEKWCYFI